MAHYIVDDRACVEVSPMKTLHLEIAEAKTGIEVLQGGGLVMCGFLQKTLRLEWHGAHHCSSP